MMIAGMSSRDVGCVVDRVLLETQGFEEKFEEFCKGEGDGTWEREWKLVFFSHSLQLQS